MMALFLPPFPAQEPDPSSDPTILIPDLQGDETIHVLMEPTGWHGVNAVAEVGLGSGLYNVMDELTRSYSSPYQGLEEVEMLEFALWQRPETGTPPVAVEGSIPELDGEYLVHTGLNEFTTEPPLPLTAIGVQCWSSSATGSAKLDGFVGRARDFRREDVTGLGDLQFHMWNLPRFSFAVPGHVSSRHQRQQRL
jgi:hypothetical protein